MSSPPAPIVLDGTLRDLYATDGDSDDIALAYAVPTAEVQMAAGIPISKKFAYQSPALSTHDADTLAREFLQLVPQLFGFVAGKMRLVMFDLDPNPSDAQALSSPDQMRPHQADAHRVFDRLAPLQRPILTFVSSPSEIEPSPTTKYAIVNPMDCLLPLPHLVAPESHYELLSKRALALSGLPTPPSELLDTVLGPAQVSDTELVAYEAERLLARVRARPLPFVLKMPQSLSGQGTFLLRTEAERTEALRVLQPETIRMLQQITWDNAHMTPCALIMQSMAPGQAVALSLFITKSGKAVFNACCSQLVDTEGNWGGGLCDYREQDALQREYAGTADKLAGYMHEMGYWGPMGVDVMTDEEGRQLVIDMNVRVTGSHPLGALRTHFTKLGLNVAVLFFPLMLRVTRDEFDAVFREEVCFGSLVVNAWVHMPDGKTSMTTVTLAAEDRERLNAFVERIDRFKIQDH